MLIDVSVKATLTGTGAGSNIGEGSLSVVELFIALRLNSSSVTLKKMNLRHLCYFFKLDQLRSWIETGIWSASNVSEAQLLVAFWQLHKEMAAPVQLGKDELDKA